MENARGGEGTCLRLDAPPPQQTLAALINDGKAPSVIIARGFPLRQWKQPPYVQSQSSNLPSQVLNVQSQRRNVSSEATNVSSQPQEVALKTPNGSQCSKAETQQVSQQLAEQNSQQQENPLNMATQSIRSDDLEPYSQRSEADVSSDGPVLSQGQMLSQFARESGTRRFEEFKSDSNSD